MKYRTSMPNRLLRCIHSLNGHWDFSMFTVKCSSLVVLCMMGLWESRDWGWSEVKVDTKRTRGGHEADTGRRRADTMRRRSRWDADTKQTRSRYEDEHEALPPFPCRIEADTKWRRASPTPLRLQGCSTTQGNLPRLLLGRTRLQHQASLKSVSVRLQVARSAAFFNIKLWRCCDPDSLSPKVGHHLHLASSAVPRYRPQQAVATCYPNLVRRPRPLWCKISVLPHVAHGSATKSWWLSWPSLSGTRRALTTSFSSRFWRPSPPPSFSEHSSTAAKTTTATGSPLQLPSLPWRLLTMVIPTKTRCWQFLTGESPLASWLVSLLAACTLKQVKMGHLICPEMPEAPKSGAVRSTDLANLLVLAS